MRKLIFLLPILLLRVNAFAQCSLDLGQDTVYFCDGDCVSLDAGAGWTTIQWSSGEITQTICDSETGWFFAQVQDGLGCTSTDSVLCIKLIHLISASDSAICLGDTVSLMANMYAEVVSAGALYDTTFLPDGSGVNYQTEILVQSYETGATFNGATEILEICAALEHSWLGDLEMMLTCPNGTNAIVFDSYTGTGIGPEFAGGFGGGGTFLGQPIDIAVGIGVPWDYCFSDLANWETLGAEYQAGNFTAVVTPSPGNSMTSGHYKPEQSFAVFDGCPLNGLWTLTIRDNLTQDDGYISFWGLGISNNIGEVSYHWSTGQDSAQIQIPVVEPSTWVDMTAQGVTCTDTAQFDFHPFPEVLIGFDNADCNESTGQIINQTSPADSVLMEIFTQTGIPIPAELLDPGLYDVTLTSSQGCSTDTTIEIITQIDSAEYITGATVVFPGQQFTYSVPYSACLNYSWSIDNGTIVSGQGTNEVQVTWNNSISGWIAVDMSETRDFNQQLILYVGTATGIADLDQDGNTLSLRNQSLIVSQNINQAQLLVLNATGQLVKSDSVAGGQVIDCSTLTAGFYTAVMQSENQQSVLKFIITD